LNLAAIAGRGMMGENIIEVLAKKQYNIYEIGCSLQFASYGVTNHRTF
jgi:3-hydroxyacyl-CoA dehydrogenase